MCPMLAGVAWVLAFRGGRKLASLELTAYALILLERHRLTAASTGLDSRACIAMRCASAQICESARSSTRTRHLAERRDSALQHVLAVSVGKVLDVLDARSRSI